MHMPMVLEAAQPAALAAHAALLLLLLLVLKERCSGARGLQAQVTTSGRSCQP